MDFLRARPVTGHQQLQHHPQHHNQHLNQQQSPTSALLASAAASLATSVSPPQPSPLTSNPDDGHQPIQSMTQHVTQSASSSAANLLGLGQDSGPILYMEPNRTSAYDDIRSVIIYISFVTLLLGFLIIFPGIRHDKIPTFICIPTSLFVTCFILIALTGTTWHIGEAPISAAYKAFSRDRIQGDLSVKIGLQSVNITLRAHKYYILHSSKGPMMMENNFMLSGASQTGKQQISISSNNLKQQQSTQAPSDTTQPETTTTETSQDFNNNNNYDIKIIKGQKYSIKRINVDINYNERFYWIEPNQMRQEHHSALKRGLPYPILTVVEYLSQDEAGFSWSRQYRQAGYYTYILLCVTLSCCALMFLFHCAAPIYAIYTLQLIGFLLLLTNFTYAMLVPRGKQSLVIPFEGQRLTFNYGYDYWLIFFGGCLALVVGSILAIINMFWPLTTILDHDFDAHNGYYRHRKRKEAIKTVDAGNGDSTISSNTGATNRLVVQKPSKPPFSLTSANQVKKAQKGLIIRKNSDTKSPARNVSVNNQLKQYQMETSEHNQITAINTKVNQQQQATAAATKKKTSVTGRPNPSFLDDSNSTTNNYDAPIISSL